MKIQKKLLLLFTVLLLGSVSWAQQVPLLHNIWNRHIQSLDGNWHYLVDVQDMGFYDYRMKETPWGFFRNAKARRPSDLVEYDFDKCPQMKIPTDWNTADSKLFFYEGSVWFKRDFNYIPVTGKKAILYFGAVNYKSVVYVNGKKVGSHIGGFTPFNFDVTTFLHKGVNTVIVLVDNKRHAEDVPTQIFDWWNYGGITRDVMLAEVDDTYIEDYTVQLDKRNPRIIHCSVNLNEQKPGVAVRLSIPELRIKKMLVTNKQGKASLDFRARPVLWNPENPKRYRVVLALNRESMADSIGFRTIETRGKQILLNGKPVFLRGVSFHDEAPYKHGRLTTTAEAHQLLSWAKELGCNFVRLAHYPHNEKTIREAERMGIMVWEEIPCYWTIAWKNPATYANACNQLKDMIHRDHNRANVIIWSIANETPHSESRDKFLANLAVYARSLDTTRLISMAMEVTSARNYVNRLNDNMNKYVDVVSFNQYVGWYRDVNDAHKMKWVIPYDKPVIVSEFGGGALAGFHGSKEQRWTEEFQENLYRENLAMLNKIDGLSGVIPWLLVDCYSPRRPLVGIQDWHNRKGLVSDQGQKKKAFYVVRKWYKDKVCRQMKMDSVFAVINKVSGYWLKHYPAATLSTWDNVAFQTAGKAVFQLMGNPLNLKKVRASSDSWGGDSLSVIMIDMMKKYRKTGKETYLDKLCDTMKNDGGRIQDKNIRNFRDGWELAGLAEILQSMPQRDKHKMFFVNEFVRLSQAVAPLQHSEGFWTCGAEKRRRIDDVSETAFCTYGLLWGMNNGILDKEEYGPVAKNAWHYLTGTVMRRDGKIGDMPVKGRKSRSVLMSRRDFEYNWGTCAFLLAACEYARFVR